VLEILNEKTMKLTVIILWLFSWQVAAWGGNLNNGTNAGLGYANFNNTTGANTNYSSHLCLKENLTFVITPALAEKYKIKNTVSSHSKRKLHFVQAQQMKRKGDLFEKLCDKGNIEIAYKNAKKGKRYYKDVIEIEKNPDKYINELQSLLINNQFVNSKYKVFSKNTGHKIREIYKLPFYPDRIVHHCIVQVCQPVWIQLFIRDTYSTIPCRGIHDGLNRLKNALKDVQNTQYCLKLDVRKYYPSIDHQILKSIIRQKIKDKNLLSLIDKIIESAPGVPIGNYLSQWLGNLYLAYFDHFVKENLKVKYYFRYCDDMVLLSNDKSQLWEWKNNIEKYLNNNLKLDLKSNYQVFPVNIRGIDFLGYKCFYNYALIRKSIKQEFKRKLKNKIATPQTQSAYWGWFKYANTFNLTQKYFKNERKS